jgi:hypothetical protein
VTIVGSRGWARAVSAQSSSVHRRTPRARDLAPGPLSPYGDGNRLLALGEIVKASAASSSQTRRRGRSQARARPAPR